MYKSYLVLPHMEEVRIQFCSTLAILGRIQEVYHQLMMIYLVTMNLKLAYLGANMPPCTICIGRGYKVLLNQHFCIAAYGGTTR